MFRDKLQFFIFSTLRSKKAKKFNSIQRSDVVQQSLYGISKKYSDMIPFELAVKTKILIFIFFAPLVIRHVIVNPWSEVLTVKRNRYLDINLTSISCGFAVYVSYKLN